ncbi:SPASM domain-containing protein [Candidatus Woesearchaeota archaeon]|jgi:uncharacterized protein|nr:SPASM domain-containing protein [Candidatus Woesearchaeota archaeon]
MDSNDYRLTFLTYSKKLENNFVGLYNPIGDHNFLFIPENIFEKVLKSKEISNQSLEKLIEKNFLVPKNFSEEKYLDSFKKELKLEIHLMYLLINQNCNLRCDYCFENLKENHSYFQMPLETARNSIDFFLKSSSPERKIIFYGGEPLMNKKTFLGAVKYIRDKEEDKTKISVVTNGTFVDNQLVNFLKGQNVDIAISIDGPKNIHDSARRYLSGEGSFENVIKSFYLLKEEGIIPSISCTIGEHNVNELEEVATFFANELKPLSVGFNIMIGEKSTENFVKKASSNLFKAYKILKESGIYEDRVMRRLESIFNGKFYLKECAAYGNQIAVRYDGKIGPCHAFCSKGDYFFGNINDPNFKLNSNIFHDWTNRNQIYNETCRKCPFVLLCGGGCAHNSKVEFEDINEIDKNICVHTKMLVDWVMEELWKKKVK